MRHLFLTLAVALTAWISASADSAPSFPGGTEALDKYIETSIKYPQPALDNGIEGIVQVSFTVNPDGSIGAIKIVRMIDPDLEQEAIRIVKNMPEWTPAEKGGQPVAHSVTIPVKFTLPQ